MSGHFFELQHLKKMCCLFLQSGGTEAVEASMVSDFAFQYHHRNMQGTGCSLNTQGSFTELADAS